MPTTTGRFQTEKASRYLQQLCKHFGHKTEVSFTPEQGRVTFPLGTANMTATADELVVAFDLNDGADTDRAHMIIDKHLARFAFREDFTAMTWSQDAA